MDTDEWLKELKPKATKMYRDSLGAGNHPVKARVIVQEHFFLSNNQIMFVLHDEELKEWDKDRERWLTSIVPTAWDVFADRLMQGGEHDEGLKDVASRFHVSKLEAERIITNAVRHGRRVWELGVDAGCVYRVLRDEIGLDGGRDEIELVRKVLCCARDMRDSLRDNNLDSGRQAFDHLCVVLNYDQNPALATWFVRLLSDRWFVLGDDGVQCWILSKGEQLLDAIDTWYSPDREKKRGRGEKKGTVV